MRSSTPKVQTCVFLAAVLLTAACGDHQVDAAAEAAGDASLDTRANVVDSIVVDDVIEPEPVCAPGGACGINGTCRPDDSRTCTCVDHAFVCSSCSVPTTRGCPDVLPCSGTDCSEEGTACYYDSACGGIDDTVCIGGHWGTRVGRCSACPGEEPIPGSNCAGSMPRCELATECRSHGRAWCIDDRWSVYRACGDAIECDAKATPGAACAAEHVECTRANGCGGRDRLTCRAGAWARTASSCCPATAPTSGAPCTAPSALACAYAGTDCYCQSDGTFVCWPRPECTHGAACSGSFVCTPPKAISNVCVCRSGKLECEPLTPGL